MVNHTSGVNMPEVVKSPAMIIIALAVFLILIFLAFELFYKVKIARAICNFTGGILLSATGYAGVLVGITKIGIEAACNLFPF